MPPGFPELSLDEACIGDYYPLAHTLARNLRGCESDQDDLVQVGIVALWKALQDVAAGGTEIRNTKAFAITVLLREMKWWYRQGKHSLSHQGYTTIEDGGFVPVVDGEEEWFQQTYLQEYVAEVGRLLGPVAQRMAANLLSPGEAVSGLAVQELRTKESKAAQGESVRGHKTCVIKHEHIRNALGIGEYEWERQLSALRGFTRSFVSSSLAGFHTGQSC